MKRRSVCLLLSGAMVLGLSACTAIPDAGHDYSDAHDQGHGTTPTPSAAPTPTPEPTSTPFTVLEADVPPGEYAPWQEAYADFLRQLRREEGELRNWYQNTTQEERKADPDRVVASEADVSDSYALYDVDEDGIPELFVKYGQVAVAYHTVCYALREGQVVEVGEIGSPYANLYTWPGENAVVVFIARQGIYSIEQYTMTDGLLTFQEQILAEDLVGTDRYEPTRPGELVPGSEEIPVYPSGNQPRPPQVPALLLPVYEYGAPTRQNPAPMDEAEVRAAIGKVLWEGAELYGVSGDGAYGDTGPITLDEYRHPGVAYSFSKEPLFLAQYAWADANGDGQTDCILRMEEIREKSGFTSRPYVILSLEEGGVYAYFFRSLGEPTVAPNGSVYFGETRQVSFYKNQCYSYSATPPAHADGLVWDDFTAAP